MDLQQFLAEQLISSQQGESAVFVGKSLAFGEVLQQIAIDNHLKETTERLRAIREEDGKKYTALKGVVLPCVIPGALFPEKVARDVANIDVYTGITYIDIDHAGNAIDIVRTLKYDPYVVAARITSSGDGLRIYFYVGEVTSESEHSQAWEACNEYISTHYTIETDSQSPGRSPVALDFVSYDPNIYVNENPSVFFDWQYEEEKTWNVVTQHPGSANNHLDDALSFLPADLPYKDWWRSCAAYQRGGGTYEYWHEWCKTASFKYDEKECEKTWRSFDKSGAIGPGTLFFIAKQYGWSPPPAMQVMAANNMQAKVAVRETVVLPASSKKKDMPEGVDKLYEQTRMGLEEILSDMKIVIRWNEVTLMPEFKLKDEWISGDEDFIIWLWSEVNSNFWTFGPRSMKRIKFNKGEFIDYIVVIGQYDRYDPVVDWINALPEWDGVYRLNKWITNCLGLGKEPQNEQEWELIEFANAIVPLGIVKRNIEPGATHDVMPVLYGEEGVGKSFIWRRILPPQFRRFFNAEIPIGAPPKQIAEDMRGKILGEWSELTGADYRTLEAIKNSISKEDDTARVAYARFSRDYLRRWVSAGTANPEGSGVLPATAGRHRRFILLPVSETPPMSVPEIEVYLDENREQIFAEAKARLDDDWNANIVPQSLRPVQYAINKENTRKDEGVRDILNWVSLNMGEHLLPENGLTVTNAWDAYHAAKGLPNHRPKGRGWEPLNQEFAGRGYVRIRKGTLHVWVMPPVEE